MLLSLCFISVNYPSLIFSIYSVNFSVRDF